MDWFTETLGYFVFVVLCSDDACYTILLVLIRYYFPRSYNSFFSNFLLNEVSFAVLLVMYSVAC